MVNNNNNNNNNNNSNQTVSESNTLIRPALGTSQSVLIRGVASFQGSEFTTLLELLQPHAKLTKFTSGVKIPGTIILNSAHSRLWQHPPIKIITHSLLLLLRQIGQCGRTLWTAYQLLLSPSSWSHFSIIIILHSHIQIHNTSIQSVTSAKAISLICLQEKYKVYFSTLLISSIYCIQATYALEGGAVNN